MLKFLLRACVFLSFLPACGVAIADEMSDAREASIRVLEDLEQRKNASVWNAGMSEWFKERMTNDAFLANMTTVQAQLGGAASDRKLVQQNRADSNPPTGYKGPVFTFMFATTFPAAKTYETVVMIKEGGLYKVSGLNWIPNPN
jgi:hypothetical protein